MAELRVWRTGPVARTVDLLARGDVGLRDDKLALTVRGLETDARVALAERRLPWTVEMEIPPLPLRVSALQTVSGAVVVRGTVGEEDR